jgi:Zn-dependent peptidase ImmA (M78 family)
LNWAIAEAGVDATEVAQSAKVDQADVAAWIEGGAMPTKTQFKRLISFLKRPASFFFLPEPPEQAALPAAFRHPPGGMRDPTQAELEQLRKARRAQKVGKWLAGHVSDDQWSRDPAPLVGPGVQPARAADLARAWLSWSVTEQQNAATPTAVVRLIRARLEERGILTMQLSLGKDGARGFSLYDEQKPVVAINTHYIAEARLFSYGHELGHLMRRNDAVCIGFASTKAERWCEEFAANFLLPKDALKEAIERRFGSGHFFTDMTDLRRIAADFRVSLSATAIRLEGLGWGQEGLFGLIPKGSDVKKQRGGPAGTDTTRGAVRRREFGDAYFGLVLAGERVGALGHQDVLRYLDVSDQHLRKLSAESLEPFET